MYLKAVKAVTKNQSASRLSACAAVVRLAVEVGVRKIRSKTVRALIDHVTQTLPTLNEGFCEPLRSDYLKSLRILLEYQPHVEHMHKDEWQELVDFCREGITLSQGGSSGTSLSFRASQYISSGTRGSTPEPTTAVGHRRCSGTQNSSNGFPRDSVEELVTCLHELTSAPNAPVLSRAHVIVTAITDLLQSSSHPGRAHQAAFATVNQVLSRVAANDIRLSWDIVKVMVPFVRRFWSMKSPILKDEMLVTLIYAKPYILKSATDEEQEREFASELEALTETIHSEYSKRAERDQLQLDDLALSNRVGLPPPLPPTISGLHLRQGSGRAEQPWMILQVTAFLLSVLIKYRGAKAEFIDADDSEESRKKRRRRAQQLDDLLRQAKYSLLTERLCALQMLPFLLYEISVTEDEVVQVIDLLLSCISDENGSVASWAMIGITR